MPNEDGTGPDPNCPTKGQGQKGDGCDGCCKNKGQCGGHKHTDDDDDESE